MEMAISLMVIGLAVLILFVIPAIFSSGNRSDTSHYSVASDLSQIRYTGAMGRQHLQSASDEYVQDIQDILRRW